jgi:rhodanese-related sulfurtransferase
MKHDIQRSLTPASRSLGWVAALLFALSGCGLSTQESVDAGAEDSAVSPKGDVAAQSGADAATSTRPDAIETDAGASKADALAQDAKLDRADAIAPDAARGSADADGGDAISVGNEDASPDVAPRRSDALTVDGAPARADTMVLADTSPRADALVEEPDAEALLCKATGTPATLVRLSPQELKTILDGSEDPYLINVKGTSIPNIPGTDAVLASDVAGIEALVGGNLCADIILYCRSGNTSQTVAAQLIAKGYLKVRDLEGGIGAWTDAGYPTE